MRQKRIRAKFPWLRLPWLFLPTSHAPTRLGHDASHWCNFDQSTRNRVKNDNLRENAHEVKQLLSG